MYLETMHSFSFKSSVKKQEKITGYPLKQSGNMLPEQEVPLHILGVTVTLSYIFMHGLKKTQQSKRTLLAPKNQINSDYMT